MSDLLIGVLAILTGIVAITAAAIAWFTVQTRRRKQKPAAFACDCGSQFAEDRKGRRHFIRRDSINHEPNSTCVCGPLKQFTSIGVVYVHQPLDRNPVS